MYLAHEFVAECEAQIGLGDTPEHAVEALVQALRENGYGKRADGIESGADDVYVAHLQNNRGSIGGDGDLCFNLGRATAPPR